MTCARAIWMFLAVAALYTPWAKANSHDYLTYKSKNVVSCPQIDDSHIIIVPSDCNKGDGSITGITATGTGTIKFTWYDANLGVVGNSADLTGVTPGTYQLEVRDQSKCTPTVKYYVVGQASPVVIDVSNVNIQPSACGSTGSIANIVVTNGHQYQWLDAYKNQVATTIDLKNVASGYYTLIASNADGCSSSKTFQVTSSIDFPQVAKIDTTLGVCDQSPGAITLTFNPRQGDPVYTYSLYDNDGLKQIVTGVLLYTDGTPVKIKLPIIQSNHPYTFILINPQGCTSVVGQYSLPPVIFQILTTPFFLVRNDACGRHTGGIIGLTLTGNTPVLPPDIPQTWIWTDSTGKVVSNVPYSLGDVGKGTYQLTVKDPAGCSDTKTFTVGDSTAEATPPVLTSSHMQLCLPGAITILVANPDPQKYKYRLYDSTQTAITENSYGMFQVNVTQTSNYYVTTIDGFCESDPTKMQVTVVAPGVIIPNTFTPNNDGVNDYWIIPHIGDFPGAEVDVFTREGQLIFHSVNYTHPFDGNYNGAKLPGGVYYYTIDLKQKACFGKIAGSLTLLR